MKIEATRYPLHYGRPDSRPLFQWITPVDLAKWNILVKDPVAIRNFICQYTDYTSDMEQFGFSEFWADPKLTLYSNKDDCEGLNGLACCVFYSLGYDCRLAVGNYSFTDKRPFSKRPRNHAYGLLFETPEDSNPYVIETTGNNIISDLKRVDACPEYYTWHMGSGVHKQNYLCNHLVKVTA